MTETCDGPSELHLKKELTALRRSRFLRDPETCSSWRSPLTSRSVAASGLNGNNTKKGITTNSSSGLYEVEHNNDIPFKLENKRKKVYLCNWERQSSRSSDGVARADKDSMQESGQASPDSILNNSQKVEPKIEAYLENSTNAGKVIRAGAFPARKSVKKPRRKATTRKKVLRNPAPSKLLDLPSSTIAALNSLEQYNNGEYCISEDANHSVPDSTQKSESTSEAASPLLSVSGYGNWSDSSKFLKTMGIEGSNCSHTPVSTSSYNKYGDQNPSTVGSWNGTTPFNEDEEDNVDLPGRQGCGLRCYSSKRRKDKGCAGWYSPSFSDTLRRKGGSMLCGSQTMNHRRRSSNVHKRKAPPKYSQDLPLLSNSCDQRSSADSESDELSINFAELDLEALSRLDGTRWSNCRSQDAQELALTASGNGPAADHRSLSQKYRPKSFGEIVGQNIVVQSLSNAVLRGRIAPAYLFQGPRGTGKTSTARVFAASLNCTSTGKNKPCGLCMECTDFASGNGSNIREVDATNKKGIERIRYLLKNLHAVKGYPRYKVFIIDECHMLSSKIWSSFIKFLEEPLSHVVFVFITIDPDNLPRALVSRCQKYLFPKIKDAYIVGRLKLFSSMEHLNIEHQALDLIALNSNGSLRDAETMLDQLSLLSKTITASLVNDLVGVVSDDKLIDLLEIALSSDTAETVRKSRELLDSGIDPMRLMSQLAGLIMDIIAGTHQLSNSRSSDQILGGRSLTEPEVDRLQQALRILSDAEKQLRHSSERSTWFTAALLQLGSGHPAEPIHSSGSSSKHSVLKLKSSASHTLKDNPACERADAFLKLHQSGSASIQQLVSGHSSPCDKSSSSLSVRENPTFDAFPDSSATAHKSDEEKLNAIWRRCIDGCHSKTLRSLLSSHGKLISIFEDDGDLVTFIVFTDPSIKSRVERFLSSITNSIEMVLRQNVKVRIGLVTAGDASGLSEQTDPSEAKQAETMRSQNEKGSTEITSFASHSEGLPRKSVEVHKPVHHTSQASDETFQVGSLPIFSSKGSTGHGTKDRVPDVPMQRRATTDEQRLESAWLQTAEKGTSGSSGLKPERNQIMPQNCYSHKNYSESAISSKHWEDELNQEIRALKIRDSECLQKKENSGGRSNGVISPSILHSNRPTANFETDSMGYDSAPGCEGLLCWKTKKSKSKGKKLVRVRSKRSSRVSCFGREKNRK